MASILLSAVHGQSTYANALLCAVIPFICFAMSSCVHIQGQSPSDMKSELKNSYLYKSTKRFYPDGTVPDNPAAIQFEMPRASVSQLSDELSDISKALGKLQQQRESIIRQQFPSVSSTTKAKIDIDKGATFASARSSKDGAITINIRVLQSIYRGSILEVYRASHGSNGMRNGDDVPDTFDPSFDPAQATGEQRTAIQEIVEWTKKVDEARGGSMVGMIFDAFSDDALDGPWFNLAQMQMDSQKLQMRYIGAIFFLLAHERGHLALKHFDRLDTILTDERRTGVFDCAARRKLEEEADAYALLLLSPHASGNLGAAMAAQSFQEFSSVAGYRSFLSYGYPLSGFSESNGEICTYDSNRVRYERLSNMENALSEQNINRFNEALSKALSEAEQQPTREQ